MPPKPSKKRSNKRKTMGPGGDMGTFDQDDELNHNKSFESEGSGVSGGGSGDHSNPNDETNDEPSTVHSISSSSSLEEEVVICATLNVGQGEKVDVKTVTETLNENEVGDKSRKKRGREISSDEEEELEEGEIKEVINGDEIEKEILAVVEKESEKIETPKVPKEENPELPEAKANVSTSSAPPDFNYVETTTTTEKQQVDLVLPATVTKLSHEGAEIYLIGTAHFSLSSQEDVTTVIRATKPDYILLELCSGRRNILAQDEERLLKEASEMNISTIMATLQNRPPNSTRLQSILHLLLLQMSASITRKLGMAPGGEFRAAVRTSTELEKRPVLCFGDRAFSVTMSRAINSLTFRQKLKLAWQFLGDADITKEEIEKCKERDLLEQLLSEMTGEFPTITEVFVNERDYFLAHNLLATAKKALQNIENPVVVGVVGMGHVAGIVKHFGTTEEQEFDRISRPPPPQPPSTTIWLLKSSVKLSGYCLLAYSAYKVFNRIDFFKKINFNSVKLGFVKVN